MTDQDETVKRMTLGREARQLLDNPLLARFFKEQESQYVKAFRQLPLDSNIEEYKIVHFALLANEQLKLALKAYVVRAETDVFDKKVQDDLPEDIDV